MAAASELLSLMTRLAELAEGAPSLPRFRAAALALVREVVPFDAAMFHALSPRVPLGTGAFVGLDPHAIAATMRSWDDWAVELAPLARAAEERRVTTDEEVFPKRSRGRRRFEQIVLRPFAAGSLCLTHLHVRGALRAAIVLLARRAGAFRGPALDTLRRLTPLLAVADALHEGADAAPRATRPMRLRCADERLTKLQRTIVEHVALGHSNAEIGRALGRSPHTIRNHLVRIFERLQASNRADVVRLAVLQTPITAPVTHP